MLTPIQPISLRASRISASCGRTRRSRHSVRDRRRRHGTSAVVTRRRSGLLLTSLRPANTKPAAVQAQTQAQGQAIPAAPTPALAAAVASAQRTDKAKARDVYRHLAQTLQFFAVEPSQTVLEIAPGGGWYTDILAAYLHDHGTLYEAQYESPLSESAAEVPRQNRKPHNVIRTPI